MPRKKRIEIDGKFYRWRDGKLVQIPEEWVGKGVTYPQTIRKRSSKETSPRAKRLRKRNKHGVSQCDISILDHTQKSGKVQTLNGDD